MYDSNYPLQHTVLFVIDHVRKKVDYYNTLSYSKEFGHDPEYKEDCKLLKQFYHISYPIDNRSNEVVKQHDNYSCTYYCSIFIQKFINKGKYKVDDSFKHISQQDIHDFKEDMLGKIRRDILENHPPKHNLPRISLVYKPKKTDTSETETHKPHFKLVYVPKTVKDVIKRNEKTEKDLEEYKKNRNKRLADTAKRRGVSKMSVSSSEVE